MLKQLTVAFVFLGIASACHSAAFAQSTFALPVTSDTGGYRKFDSTAVPGKFHAGDDYYNANLKVLATTCGTVVSKITNGNGDHGFGNVLIIKHTQSTGTVYSLYGHLASFAANTDVNKKVVKGQQIGTIGSTGTGSGGIVHLHFELKRSNTLANPYAFGSIGAGTQWGYVPKNAGTQTATSATNYGYIKPTSYYGSQSAQCN